MNISELDVLRIIVNDQRRYFNHEQIVTLREIYSFGFWIRMDKADLPLFVRVFKTNCEALGFEFCGKKSNICTYKRII